MSNIMSDRVDSSVNLKQWEKPCMEVLATSETRYDVFSGDYNGFEGDEFVRFISELL